MLLLPRSCLYFLAVAIVGWMTLFVIIYNSTEAQELVPIYVMIHLLVSSFLFILGFSHFMSFWSGTSKTLSSFVEVTKTPFFWSALQPLV